MTRIALALAVSLCMAGCKSRPKPTVPLIGDSSMIPSGEPIETPEGTLFHTILRYSGHTAQAMAFYRPEMEKRGAIQNGDLITDDNLVHQGDLGRNGSASAKDPSRPGVWIGMTEVPEYTLIDIWENVPKTR